MADKDLRFTVSADGKPAKDTLEDVADLAEDLERTDITVPVDADTATAEGDLAQVDAAAKELDGRQVHVAVDLDEEKLRRATDSTRKLGDEGAQLGDRFGNVRGVSDGLGALDSRALDALEGIVDLGEGLQAVSPRLASFATALGNFAFIGAAAATGVVALVQAINSIDTAAKRATEAAKKLPDVLKALSSGDVRAGFSELLTAYDELFDKGEQLGFSVKDTFQAINGLRGPVADLARRYQDTATQVQTVDEVQKRLNISHEEARNLLSVLTTQLTVANREWNKNGAAKAQVSTRTEDLIRQLGLEEQGVQEAKDAWADYQEALAGVDQVTRDAADAARSTVSLGFSIEDAMDAAADAFDRAKAATDDHKTSVNEKAKADRDAERAIGDVIDATIAYADEQARASGQTLTAEQAQNAQKAALEGLKQKFPQLTPVIDAYVAKLDTIPTNIPTTVGLDTTKALANLHAFTRELQLASAQWAAMFQGGEADFVLPRGSTTTNVTIQAGLGTDAFAVQRAVSGALTDAARANGVRS